MYCNQCGKELADGAQFCTSCGARINTQTSSNQRGFEPQQQLQQTITINNGSNGNPYDRPSFGWALLSCLWWVLGLILFLVWRKDYPMRARSCLHGMIIGLILAALEMVYLFHVMSQIG